LFSDKLFAQSPLNWANISGGSDDDFIKDIAVDKAGNSFVCGTFSEQMRFTPSQPSNYFVQVGGSSPYGYPVNSFISKYNTSGGFSWAKQITGKSGDNYNYYYGAQRILVDEMSNIYIEGNFKDTIEIDGNILISNKPQSNYIIKLDSTGNFIWSKIFEAPGVDITAISYSNGKLASVINFQDSITIENSTFYGASGHLITILDSSGIINSIYQISSNGNYTYANFKSCIIDQQGNIFVAGIFSDTLNFANGSIQYTDSFIAFFAAKLSPTFDLLYSKVIPRCFLHNNHRPLSVDLEGNMFITGDFNTDTLRLDSILIPQDLSNLNYFIAKIDTAGQFAWGHTTSYSGEICSTFLNGEQLNLIAFNSDSTYFDHAFFTDNFGFFLLTLDESGNIISAIKDQQWGWSFFPNGNCDSLGNIYLVSNESQSTGNVFFVGYSLPGYGEIDGCIGKIENPILKIQETDNSNKNILGEIFPTVSNSEIFIKLKSPCNISIMSSTGQILRNFSQESSINSYDISNFSKGLYWVRLANENNFQFEKFIIQ